MTSRTRVRARVGCKPLTKMCPAGSFTIAATPTAHACASEETFSLNLFYKRQPAIWTVAGLPYDAHTVVPVPPPEGGALVLCSDFIVYISQGNSTAWACSSFAQAGDALAGRASDAKRAEMPEPSEGDPGHSAMVKNARRAACIVSPDTLPAIAAKAGKLTFPDGPPADLDLEFAHAAFVSPTTALLSLRDGRLIQLRLVADRSRVRALEARPCGACSVPSCAAALGAGLLFLGSYVGDSALLRFRQGRGASTDVAPAELEESEDFDGKREDGVMLDRGGDDSGPTRIGVAARPEDALDGEVVGFGSTGGEHNCRGSRAQIVGDGLTSLFHDAASSTTGRMQGRRITSNSRSVQPGLSCLGKQRCRCRVVDKVPGGAMYSAPGRGAREIHIACRIHVGIVTHCPMVARKIAQSVGAAVDLVGQLGNDFEEVPDHAKVSKLE